MECLTGRYSVHPVTDVKLRRVVLTVCSFKVNHLSLQVFIGPIRHPFPKPMHRNHHKTFDRSRQPEKLK